MRMNQLRIVSVSFAVFFSLAVGALAQGPPPAAGGPPAGMPGPGGPGGPPRGPRPKPQNIQALPKDISGDEVIKLMREYEGALGVECEYCHAQNPTTHRNDTASDANPMKGTARTMIRMTEQINMKYLAELGTGPHAPKVSCGTCHQGQAHPPEFVPKPQAPRAPGGMPPGGMAPPKPPM